MCTLTLLRGAQLEAAAQRPLWRVVFNRDERRTRTMAQPPTVHVYAGTRVIHPIDSDGGGTWIAASERGLVFALLNGEEMPSAPGAELEAFESRGRIIPTLAASPAVRAAEVPLAGIDARRYRPFRLVIADDREIVELVNTGGALEPVLFESSDRLIRTSSSVEAGSVCAWRKRLFEAIAPSSSEVQDAFHLRSEPDRPAFGVLMARPDASTVSITTIEVFAGCLRMTYRPVPGQAVTRVTDLARAS